MIDLHLPFPPSVNNYWAHTRYGVRLKKHAKVYREKVAEEVRENGVDIGLRCKLSLKVVLHAPDKRRRDIDNTMKALLDALEHAGVYHNDNQIDELHIIRGDQIENGKVLVIIERMDGEEISPEEECQVIMWR